ncbi:MAG: retropepsin-like domain-containing protein [Candidatus Eremiobacteraeota bacterium]|nr:retropepsin-like domain-containing protein [Candidatus Eremiobacteraeota bacterium]
MKRALTIASVLLCLAGAPAFAQSVLAKADTLFQAGSFREAEAAYLDALRGEPSNAHAALQLARLELYRNELGAAKRDYAAAARLPGADNARIQRDLATIAQREAVANAGASVSLPAGGLAIPMLALDPLPLFSVTVNGHLGHFLLDTGAPDLVVDSDFAKEIGLQTTALGEGIFAGGKRAQIARATVAEFSLGSVVMHDLDADVSPTRPVQLFDTPVDGIIGTVFLEHFLSTIDYPRHRLVLRPRAQSHAFEAALPQTAVLANLYLVGDHFLFSHGTINDLRGQTLLLDSGLAGGGFTADKPTLDAAHIALDTEHAERGMGGGGAVQAIPFVVDKLCVGVACQRNIRGLFTPEGSAMGIFPFTVGGTVSHQFLERYAVTFDFDAMRVALVP